MRRFMNCCESRSIEGFYFSEIKMKFKKGWEGDWQTLCREVNEQR